MQDVVKSFDEKLILDGISFCIHPGEVVGLLGKNGAGKTTLIKLLSGLLTPDAGSITIYDAPLTAMTIRDRVALVQEGRPSLYEFMSPRANLKYFGQLLAIKDLSVQVDEALTAVGLEEVADEPLLHLSFGTKRRAGLALGYLKNASLLLLDEPSASLDLHNVLKLRTSITAFSQAGRAVLLTGHELGFLESICTRFLLLKEGVLASSGSLLELTQDVPISQEFDVWLRGKVSFGKVIESNDQATRVILSTNELHQLKDSNVLSIRSTGSILEHLLGA